MLIPHLGGGGAEKIVTHLARELSRAKYEVHLCLVTATSVPKEAFPPQVTVHALPATRVRASALRLLSLVRSLQPRVIVSGIFHLNFLVLLLRPLYPRGVKVIVRQNGTVSASLASDGLPAYTRLLYRMLYPWADRIICQSAAMAHDLATEIGISAQRLVVLPNPVEVDGLRALAASFPMQWTGPGPHLLAVGRLSREKGFDLLLRALARLREQFPHADLVIAGAGSEEFALRSLCHDLGLEAAVFFAGYIDQPAARFPGASAFVLPSRHEGLPNALLEAAAAGLPLIATPASRGVTDLLHGQAGVWLAREVTAEALAGAMLDALVALEPGQRFEHAFINQFRLERAIAAYQDLIDATISGQQS